MAVKGKTNNPKGRPKGKPNKVTTEVKTWIQKLIDDNRKQLEMDLEALEPKERWAVIEKLLSYTLPKQQAVTSQINFENLTDSQLSDIINAININDNER